MAHPHASEVPSRRERAHALIARTGHHLERGGHADMREDAKMIAKGIHEHEDHEHGGRHTKLKFESGGAVHGDAHSGHLGRRARGGPTAGKKGHQTHVNVIVAPQGGGMRPPMPAMPAAPPPRPMAPPPAPPPRPPMGAAPPGAGMMPPGGGMRPPGMMKRGGGVKTVEEGTPSENLMQANKGGKVRKRDLGGPTGPMPGAIQQGPTPQAQAIQQAMAQRQGMPMQKRGGKTEERKNGGGVHMEAGAGGAEGRIEKMHEYGEGGFKPKEHKGEFGKARG